jgi:hypothetical protein
MSKKKIKKPSPAARLKELEKEHLKGTQAIAAIDKQRGNLVQQVLQIQGAMTAYQEMIDPPSEPDIKPAKETPDGTKSK